MISSGKPCICESAALTDDYYCSGCRTLANRGAYHPDPEIDAEIRADWELGRAVDRAAGIREGWHRSHSTQVDYPFHPLWRGR